MKMGAMMMAERVQAVRATTDATKGVLYLVALIGWQTARNLQRRRIEIFIGTYICIQLDSLRI
jgi:hypothetical protein